jgi:hypothetical protein
VRSLRLAGRLALARWALPPAALAAIGCFAAHEVDPAAAAEGAYLARVAAAVLVAVAALAPAPAAELGLGAALAGAAVWALPAGPGRGAVVLALLVAALLVASARRLLRGHAAGAGFGTSMAAIHAGFPVARRGFQDEGAPAYRADTPVDLLPTTIALCFGWQVLLRGELLFAPGHAARPWAALLVLPVVAGFAVARLWQRRGMLPALAAAAIAAVLAPGWTVATALALVALAAGDSLAAAAADRTAGDRASEDRAGEDRAGEDRVGEDRTNDHLGRADLTTPRRWPWATRAAAMAALLLPVAWEPRSGWAAALAGLALWRPGLATGAALALAVAIRTAPLAGIHLPGALAAHASWHEAGLGLAWLVILAPAALPALRRRSAVLTAAAVAALALAVPWLPDRSALAAPVALAALALPATGAAAGIAALWSAAVLLGTALLASYPWLRQDPLGDAMALLGAAPGPALAAAIGGIALLLGIATELAARRTTAGNADGSGEPARLAVGSAFHASPGRSSAAAAASSPDAGAPDRLAPIGASRSSPGSLTAAGVAARAARAAAWGAGAMLFAALAGPRLASPGTDLIVPGDTVLLDASRPSWQTDLGPRRARALVIESSMVNAAGLAGGQPVARVRLLGTASAPIELPLRAGADTGEWAARRPDVASTARLRAPRPWLAWVAGDFFGQRYRCRLPLPAAGSFARLQIELAGGLPAATGLALHQVEVEP